jgi:hypothetical protein
MSDASRAERPEPDPVEVEPTDNSVGTEVDLERVADVEREAEEHG